MRRGFGNLWSSLGMLGRLLILSVILSSELCPVKGQGYPCFTAERIPGRDRRFFAFVPSNVRSNPPVECVFLFGGPPGTRLRMTAYDVQTSESSSSPGRCTGAALRVYDVGRRGLQLVATYCGFVRRGQLLALSSNMAIVTFMAYNNVMNNAFSLVIDSVEREAVQRLPCPPPIAPTEPATTTPIPSTTAIPDSTSESSEESDSNSSEGSGYADEEREDAEGNVEEGGDEDLEVELEEGKDEEGLEAPKDEEDVDDEGGEEEGGEEEDGEEEDGEEEGGEEEDGEEREENEEEENETGEITKASSVHKGNELYDYFSLENTTHQIIPEELQQIL